MTSGLNAEGWPDALTRRPAFAGDLAADVDALLAAHGRDVTREHVPRVAREAVRLARRFGVDVGAARTAALLHDVGGIVRRADMVALCRALALPVEAEEEQVPMLLHAKLSVVLARERYGVTDPAALQAIRYHTTLHARPTPLDLVVFLADKLEWDQGGVPPYHAALSAALDGGLEAGARSMLAWMATPAAHLLLPHPDLRAAWAAFGITPAGPGRSG
ncbi:putative HD superfamily hydrolase involved in NAD metabolism [Deinococcus metalli]|uniref:bis(5'-nucleosyl)-tetraphosphatase (symmetrical) n=1 Tax=Deinococcus metalli TaxID=1141878 RepID=A0A7W8NQJ0_9DEIO|nr:bis(5'-nucleosyl)-tetraphosphatase (symmetrical) YqeK [Deinococcus metalli]MBB5376835.1 putative HD superfamily hydrolase involved in NAD metabolism [Deinococcus metalli]GHF45714.1 HDIG domain-containing protein [Deinococcus metalli]